MKKREKPVTKKLKNYLIDNKDYTEVLEILGLSPKPLSSYEINQEFTKLSNEIEQDKKKTVRKEKVETKWKRKLNQYTYRMIRNLRPNLIDTYYTYLFNWDEIINDESQKKLVIKYIKEKFKIDLAISGNSFREREILPLFNRSNDNKIINIESHSKHIQVSIQKTRYNNVEIILEQNKEKKISSLRIKNNNEVYVPITSNDEPFPTFMNAFYWKKPFFLNVSYSYKIKKKKSKESHISKKSQLDLTPLNYAEETIDVIENGYIIRRPLKNYISKEIYEINKNFSKSHSQTNVERVEKSITIEKYSLNTRGLLLYILGKTTSTKKENENENPLNQKEFLRNREKYRKNIFNVLSNLSENYTSDFPFLLYYNRFREIFKDVRKNHQSFRYYDVDILRTIANELEGQIWLDDRYFNLDINRNNDVLLNYLTTKRYSAEVTHYLAYFSKELKEDYKEFLDLFRDYQKKMLTIMLEYLKEEEDSVKHLLDEFNYKGLLIL